MLKVDYTLTTEKGKETRKDVPLEEIREVNGNIMLVQGPSSMGKSTVMNMIAIGSFGESDESLSNSVRANLRELTSSSYRDLKFDIELDNQYCNSKLLMSKPSGKKDIKVIEEIDGQKTILSADTFRKKYNLIYDVPENPTKRLEQIRDTIRNDHKEAKDAIWKFVEYLKDVRKEVSKVPSKDTINQNRADLVTEKKQYEQYEMDFRTLETKKIRVGVAVPCRRYLTLKKKIEDLESKIINERKKPVSDKSDIELRTDAMNAYMKASVDIMISPITKATITKTKNLELIRLLEDANNFDLASGYNNLRSYIGIISKMIDLVPENDEDKVAVHTINSLLSILERADSQMSLGSIGTVDDLLKKLKYFKENSGIGSSIKYAGIRKELISIKMKYTRVENLAKKIDEATDKPPVVTRNVALISKWEKEKNNSQTELNKCRDDLIGKDIDIPNVTKELHRYCGDLGVSITSNLEELEKLKSDVDLEYNSLKKKMDDCKKQIDRYTESINRFDNNELPKYYADSEYLTDIIDGSSAIRALIEGADKRLQKVINHDDSEYKINPDLYDNMWRYIGSKLEVVRDCGKEYKVSRVDLLIEEKGTIYTEDGVEIHIGAMGTGEGQLSYLRGLLSTGDNRKIIALFDEVGNMSNNLLTSLTEDFVKLEKEGKLMMAFMARPTSDEFEVKIYD